jgi:signal transduction histidine kinase
MNNKMKPITRVQPIRNSLLISVVGFVFILVAVSLLFISKQFLAESNQRAKENIIHWSQLIAKLSTDDIIQDNNVDLSGKLQYFSAVKNIHYIDIYKFYPNNPDGEQLGIFSIYHHQRKQNDNQSINAFRLTEQEKKNLIQPKINGDIIEYFTPIQFQDNTIGHIYIQVNSELGLNYYNKSLIFLVITFIVLLITVFFIAFRLENTITSPLKAISAGILQISQAKDYTVRLESMTYREADILARNINHLLNRTERHIDKLGLAEQQSLKLNLELEDKVMSRTAALKESNQELLSTLEKLHQFQDQLVESEKMASLGDMVAGVAHEVNTPIGLGVTASTLLSDRLDEIKLAFDDKTLKSSQLKRFLNDGQENVGIIYRNLNRAAELISSFKKVAVDQSSDDIRQFNISELLHEVLLTLAPQIKNTPYNIEFDCPDNLCIVSKPGPINQILINLILNSIIHGFENRDYGTINIHVMQLSEQLNITYRDDGMGIDSSIKHKIFEPFTTTKRGEGGSGLGLHLVYNLVTQALGGTINLDSAEGHGASFEINFPINEHTL